MSKYEPARDLTAGRLPLDPSTPIVRKGATASLKAEPAFVTTGAVSTSLPSEPAAPSSSPGVVPVTVNPAPAHVNRDILDKIAPRGE